MSDTVHNVTTLPEKPNALRKFAIRSIVLAAAGTVVVAVINRKFGSSEDDVTTTA